MKSDAYAIAKIMGRTSLGKRDPTENLPSELQAEYAEAMRRLESPANERQAAEPKAYAFEVVERIKRWRRTKVGAAQAKDLSPDAAISSLTTAAPGKVAVGLPDGLRRQFELAVTAVEKAAPGAELEAAKRQAEIAKEALERHRAETSAREMFKSAARAPRSFTEGFGK